MALPADYITGTITLTNGSTAFTGTGTGWLAADFREGDTIPYIEGGESFAPPIIATITSNTAGTLATPWAGPNLTGVAYRMRYEWDSSRVSAQTRTMIEQLGNGNLQSISALTGPGVLVFDGPHSTVVRPETDFINGVAYDVQVDTLADRAAYDGQAEGFAVLVSNTGDGRSALFTKVTNTSGDWSDPAYITGPVGPTVTIEAGTTTTLPPGSDATFTVTPVPGGYQLNTGIPAGEGFYNAGVYNAANAYNQDDVVRHNRSSFIALQAVPAGQSPSSVYPPVDTAYWQVLVVAGQDGTGTGDVVGPSSSGNGNIATFDGTTGKLLKDGGLPLSDISSPQTALPILNGQVGNLNTILTAIKLGAAKVVFVGDSILEGVSQITYEDSPAGLVSEYLRQNFNRVAWTFENYSIAGTGVGNYVNSGYNGSHVAGPTMFPPNYQLWPNGDTPTKAWRDFAKDAAPDLLVIAFGMNTGPAGDEGSNASAFNSIIDYVETWAKVPSIIIVTPILSSRINSGASPYQYVQAMADAWRGVAAQRNVSLADANAIYRLLLDGVDVQRTPSRRRTFSNFADWLNKGSGTRPTVSGGTMTFAAPGWVENPDVVSNFDVTATFNMDGTDIFDLPYRYREEAVAPSDGYILRVLHGSGGSTARWYGPGNVQLASQGIATAAAYKVHVEAIGARHRLWVNDVALALPNGGLHYGQLYPGRVGLQCAQGAGTVTWFDARLGVAKVYAAPRYSEADLLGVNDWNTNLDSIGGNALNHPSVIGSLMAYFASFKPILDAMSVPQSPSLVRTGSLANTTTTIATGDYFDTTIGGFPPPQVSYAGGVSPNIFASSSNVRYMANVSSVVIAGRQNNNAPYITFTLTFPYAGNWMVLSTLTASSNNANNRHVLSAFALEVL